MNSGAKKSPLITAGIAVRLTASGAVVEDSSCGRLHYLNPTAAFVLAHCDGQTSANQIALLAMKEFDMKAVPDAAIAQILCQFAKEGLLAPDD